MRNKKLQVFVSSTYLDLKEERQAAVEAILSSGNIPAGMELFSAGNESQMTVIKRWIDESDVYLLILGGKYGSVDSKSGKSYTQLEYEYAESIGKPFFAVVISEKGLDEKVEKLGRSSIEDKHNKELGEFRSMVLSKLVRFWDDKKDIKIAIYETLSEFSHDEKLHGWIRSNELNNSNALLDEISRLTEENKELRIIKPIESEMKIGEISYDKLKKLLSSIEISIDGKKESLLNFIIEKGFKMGGEGIVFEHEPPKEEKEIFDRLSVFKLAKDYGSNNWTYRFTEYGNKFFLQILVDASNEK